MKIRHAIPVMCLLTVCGCTSPNWKVDTSTTIDTPPVKEVTYPALDDAVVQVMGSSRPGYDKTTDYVLDGSLSLTFNKAVRPLRLASIVITYTGTVSTDIDVVYTPADGSAAVIIVDSTFNNQSIVIYDLEYLRFIEGDNLVISESAAGNPDLRLNWD